MEHIAELVRTRKSVRTYDGRPLRDEDRALLGAYLEHIETPFHIPMEFRMLDAKERGLSSPVITGAGLYAAGKIKRNVLAEVAFGYAFDKPLSAERAGAYAEALELVRLAPSAVNRQPWRIARRGDAFHFFKKASLPSNPKGDVQKLDIGIALAHFMLALEESGVTGTLTAADPGIAGEKDLEYVILWQRNTSCT